MAYGSVTPKTGEIRVSTMNLVGLRLLGKYQSWRINRLRIKDEIEPYHFVSKEGKILYVNGRHQVYETDIVNLMNVGFMPTGLEMRKDLMWHPIQFRLLEKVEWLFL